MRIKVTITARSPLCFSERRPDRQFRYSTDYVPGAVLRGAVAAKMLREGKEKDATFCQLFGIQQPAAATFQHAYPGRSVLPHTALSCKDQPGFKNAKNEEDNSDNPHGVFDALVDRLCFEQLRPPGVLYHPRCPHAPECDPGRAEAFGGFYSSENLTYRKHTIPQRLLTRVAINRKRMAAEDALLYAPMVLSEAWWNNDGAVSSIERAIFSGSVWVHDDLANGLIHELKAVQHLGSGAARGLGEVTIQAKPDPVENQTQAVKKRIQELNTAVQEKWQRVGALCDSVPKCPHIFTINLRSDAILKKKGWLPTMLLTEDMLCEAAQIQDSDLSLLRSYASYDYRGGWNTGQRLPKDTELATSMGSVFVFQTEDLEKWVEPLAHLETVGLGERTTEGFGEVTICDAFHVEGRDAR